LQSIGRLIFSAQQLQDLKHRLHLLYEESLGQSEGNDEAELLAPEMDEEGDDAAGAQIFIPTETFLEELSQKLEVHPLSICRLLEEGIEEEGWRHLPEEKRSTADRFSVIIL
jgi:hypothetical protein